MPEIDSITYSAVDDATVTVIIETPGLRWTYTHGGAVRFTESVTYGTITVSPADGQRFDLKVTGLPND